MDKTITPKTPKLKSVSEQIVDKIFKQVKQED